MAQQPPDHTSTHSMAGLIRMSKDIQHLLENRTAQHGRWMVIVATCDFAYANWFVDQSCRMRIDELHVLVWKH